MRRENRLRRLLKRRAAFSKLLWHGELDWQRINFEILFVDRCGCALSTWSWPVRH